MHLSRLFFLGLLGTLLLTSTAGALTTVFSVGETKDTPSPTDNDFTRIDDALQAAAPGDVILLEGTFDWSEANALASWEAGSDKTKGTGDDFAITVPPKNDITFGASSLGHATIQGPGDLPSVDLEGFLVLTSSSGSDLFQDWEISNLQIYDFDLSLAFFFSSGSTVAFNNLVLENNHVRMATDLRSGVGDAFQNIGIHLSFGTNQTISGNVIEIPGDGVSDTTTDPMSPAFAASVALQSNTSGGTVYDGLLIDDNEVRILNAGGPDPEFIVGIWENAHAHSSNVTVSNNRFVNLDPANDPATNIQQAFRVTSHSSASTTSLYQGNEVSGANLGFGWLTGFGGIDFSGNDPVMVVGNTFTDNETAVLVRSMGNAVLRCNRFSGNALAIGNEGTLADADAMDNWFGCNDGPGMGLCDPVDATVAAMPWLVLAASVADPNLDPGEMTVVTGEMTGNSGGGMASCVIPDGVPVSFFALGGTVMPAMSTTAAGTAATTFTAGGSDLGAVSVAIDNEMQVVGIDIDATETDLAVTKLDSVFDALPGATLDYVIEITNLGPSDVAGATVDDTPPAALTDCTWTCVSNTGGTCAASGMGAIADLVDLPVGAMVRYDLSCVFQPVPDTASVINTVTVAVPAGMTDLDASNNTAMDVTHSSLAVIFADGFESGDTSMWSASAP